ncbi:MAG: hypothetical protein AB1782_11605 [Cyanobacteriota bacterium]
MTHFVHNNSLSSYFRHFKPNSNPNTFQVIHDPVQNIYNQTFINYCLGNGYPETDVFMTGDRTSYYTPDNSYSGSPLDSIRPLLDQVGKMIHETIGWSKEMQLRERIRMEEAKKLEMAKQAEELIRAEELKKLQDTRKAEETTKAEKEIRAEELKKLQDARKAEETTKTNEAKKADETKMAEEVKKADEEKTKTKIENVARAIDHAINEDCNVSRTKELLNKLSPEEKCMLEKVYKEEFGKHLRDDIRSEFYDPDETDIINILNQGVLLNDEVAALALYDAMDGGGTCEDTVNKIIYGATSEQLQRIEKIFNEYVEDGNGLREWIYDDFDGSDYRALIREIDNKTIG